MLQGEIRYKERHAPRSAYAPRRGHAPRRPRICSKERIRAAVTAHHKVRFAATAYRVEFRVGRVLKAIISVRCVRALCTEIGCSNYGEQRREHQNRSHHGVKLCHQVAVSVLVDIFEN
jgi:hypothetical protein